MVITMTYRAPSAVRRSRRRADVALATNTRREGVYFRGKLRHPIAFREAIGALHDVVIADHKYHPKQTWQEERYSLWRSAQMETYGQYYWNTHKDFFDYLYKSQHESSWMPLDPVVTVHPDQVFFECFSKDESIYGRLAAKQTMFEGLEDLSVGTTNVDFSTGLYGAMQQLRSYRETYFTLDPDGLQVATQSQSTHQEKRIDLPESWLRGFVSVQSAMLLPKAVTIHLAPVDVYNLCLFMRRNREFVGPRALRFELTPGEQPRMVFEPWETVLPVTTGVYQGAEPRVVRTWGRRRLHVLERLLPWAKAFGVTLLGKGLPTFYHVDLGDMVFTLGLSGWTANDWTGATNFSLLLAQKGGKEREAVAAKALDHLSRHHRGSIQDIATAIAAPADSVLDALRLQCEAGKVMYDFGNELFRYRPVLKEDVALDTLRYRDPREKEALELVLDERVKILALTRDEKRRRIALNGQVGTLRKHRPELTLDLDGRVVHGQCDCHFFKKNALRKGPCEHLAALKMLYERQESLESVTGAI